MAFAVLIPLLMVILYRVLSLLWGIIMGTFKATVNEPREARFKSIGLISIGLICGFLGSYGWAAMAPPTEHKGLEVEVLGFVPEDSMSVQVGLEGYKLLLRKITINPGGQIAKHSADKTPTVVYVDSGTWTEGRDNGETEHSAGDSFVEYYDTVHWFFNRGDKPAMAFVCDIKPAG
jgi:quercetin dioxygenase-like cupin family protein